MGESDPIPCPECGADNPPGTQYCQSCGAHLATPTRRRRKATGPDSRQRRAAEKALGVQRLMESARRTVATARAWLAILTVILALVALLVPDPIGQAIVLGVAATFGIGAWLLPKAPLQWILGLAGLESVFVALIVFNGGFPGWIHILVLISLWGAVPRIARAQRIAREHRDLLGPDAFLSVRNQLRKQRRQRGATDPAGQLVGRARDRRRASRSASLQSTLLVLGAIAVVSVAGVLGYRAIAAGESIDARAAEFRSHWNADRHDDLAAMLTREQRESFWPKVERLLRREGWETDLPEVDDPTFASRFDERAEVHYAIRGRPGALVKSYWNLEGSLWKVYTLRFTGLRD